MRYTGNVPTFFITGDSPEVQVFQNIRSFSYLIAKRHRFFIFRLRRFFNRYQFQLKAGKKSNKNDPEFYPK
ncbi:MAG: hypothetical protein EGQ00_00085 [Parabacteroides johnsonii]|nr:hypothetical protein [Parabacteroides johnsonii]